MMREFSFVRCFWCANLPTEDHPLEWVEREFSGRRLIVPQCAWTPCDEALARPAWDGEETDPIEDPADVPGGPYGLLFGRRHSELTPAFVPIENLTADARACWDARPPEAIDAGRWEDGVFAPVCGHWYCANPCRPLPDGFGICERLTCMQAGLLASVWDGAWRPDLLVPSTYTDGNGVQRDILAHRGRCPTHVQAPFYLDVLPRDRPDGRRDEDRDEEMGERRQTADQVRGDAVPASEWVTITDLEVLWGVTTRTAREVVKRLVTAGMIESTEVPTSSPGTMRKAYRRGVQ